MQSSGSTDSTDQPALVCPVTRSQHISEGTTLRSMSALVEELGQFQDELRARAQTDTRTGPEGTLGNKCADAGQG
jgi:hypothetical protein